MLSYEFKKIFEIKKLIALLVLLSLVTCYFTVMMCRSTSSGAPVPFDDYLGLNSYFGIMIVYIIILALVPFFPIEERNGMSQILMTSRFGREKLANTKITLALLITNLLVLLFIVASLFGYVVAFDMDFKVPITEGYVAAYKVNPNVDTFGDVVLIAMIAFVFSSNFTALFCMLLSAKWSKPFHVSILLFIGYFALGMGARIPIVGTLLALTPLSLAGHKNTFQVLFSLGSFHVTIQYIGFIVYLILIGILLVMLKSQYKSR